MMNRHTIAVVLALSLLVFAGLDGFAQADAGKKYEPNWESIDTRPLPEWFNEAKFGIFIVWGPYSVPSWVTKGYYSEWYWHHNRVISEKQRWLLQQNSVNTLIRIGCLHIWYRTHLMNFHL